MLAGSASFTIYNVAQGHSSGPGSMSGPPRPGGDAWVSIERDTGKITYEKTDRGWVSYLNDLHKGRHTGPAWSLFIDVFAIVSVVFCVTGLLLLQMYANGRPSTWPVVAAGLALPVLLALFLIH